MQERQLFNARSEAQTVRKILSILLGVLAALVAVPPLGAAELLMFEERGCPYCRRWNAEIGPGYANSAEGRIAPLRRIDITARLPDGVKLTRPVTVTPSFVLVDDGREVGRLVGYAGADFFYSLLGDVLAKLPEATTAGGAGRDAGGGAAKAVTEPMR